MQFIARQWSHLVSEFKIAEANNAFLRSREDFRAVVATNQIALEGIDPLDLGVARSGLFVHRIESHRQQNENNDRPEEDVDG